MTETTNADCILKLMLILFNSVMVYNLRTLVCYHYHTIMKGLEALIIVAEQNVFCFIISAER